MVSRALCSRNARYMPPWTMPNCNWPGFVMAAPAPRGDPDSASCRARERRAQRTVRSIDSRASSTDAGQGVHSSNAMAMSLPRRA